MYIIRFVGLVGISIMILYMLYYLASGWARVPLTVDRVTRFVIPGAPLLGFYVADYIMLIFGTMLYSISAGSKALPTIAILPISLYMIQVSGDPRYLLLIPLQVIITLILTRPSPRLLIEGFLIASTSLSILSLASIAYFSGSAGLDVLKGYILPLRIFWSVPGMISTVSLALLGLISIARRWHIDGGSLGIPSNRYILLASLSIPPVFVVITHLPSINPLLAPISVDTYYYALFLHIADTDGLWSALRTIFSERPIYGIFIYYLHMLIRDPVILMDIIHPIASIEMLVLATYYTASKLYGRGWAGWISLLTSAGHSSLGFIAGGYQANSIALPLGILLLSMRPGFLALALLILIAMIHPWTYAIYATSWVIGTMLGGRTRRDIYRAAQALLSAIASLAIGEIINRTLSGGSILKPVIQTSTSATIRLPAISSIEEIATSIINIYNAYALYLWSSTYIAPIIAMTLYSALKGLPRELSPIIFLSSLGALISVGDIALIHRIYLDTPLELAAQPALRDMYRLNKWAPTAITLTTISWSLTTLAGLTPLTGMPWEAIIKTR